MSLSNIYPFIYMLLRCSCEHLNIPVVKISQNKFVSIFLWTSSPYEDNQKSVKCISFCDWCLEIAHMLHGLLWYFRNEISFI